METFLLSKMSLNVISNYCKAVFVHISKIQFLNNLCSGTQCGRFQFLQILDLWGINFHAVVVFGLGKNFLFKSVLGHCDVRLLIEFETNQIIGTVQAPFVDLIHSWRKAMKWSFSVFLFNQIRVR